jgi:hypothetical protein
VEHGEVRILSNLPPHKDAAESIHPTVRAFDYQESRSHARLTFQLLLLFASASQVKREARCNSDGAGLGVVLALVKTEPLRMRARGPRTVHRDARDGIGHELVVVAIRTVNREADGNARAIGEEAAFGPVLAAVRRVGPGLFPPRVGPWSSTRPAKASSSRRPSHRRRPEGPGARTRGRRHSRATRQICDTPRRRNRFQLRPRHSTGSRSATRRGSLPWRCGRELEDRDIRVDASDAWAEAAPSWSTEHRQLPTAGL